MDGRTSGDVADFQRVCRELKEERQAVTELVLADWGVVQQLEPWLELPPDLDQDHLPDLVAALADAALCTFFGLDERRALVRAAVEHGEQRRQRGYEENLLYREYTLLRRALWHMIRDRFAGTRLAANAVLRLDAAITLATGASLRGYYRRTLENSGEWPAAVDRLIDDFSLPAME